MVRIFLVSAFAGGILSGAAAIMVWPDAKLQRTAAELMDVLMWSKEPVGGSFALTDHDGQSRTDLDYRGKVLLIYFGFTYCSDVCPTDLQAIGTALESLGPLAEPVQPLFITLDPETDTPAQLKTYVGLFHPKMIGLTGTPAQIRQVTRAYKVYFAKSAPSDNNDRSLDHSSVVYLMDEEGRYLGFFPPGTSAERMVQVLNPRLQTLAQRHTESPQHR